MLWFRNLDENRYIGYKNKSTDYADFIFKPEILKEFQDFLHESGVQEDLIAKTDSDGIKRLYFDTKTPLPFLKLLPAEQKHCIHFSIGTKPHLMFHFCLWMSLMHIITMNCLKVSCVLLRKCQIRRL